MTDVMHACMISVKARIMHIYMWPSEIGSELCTHRGLLCIIYYNYTCYHACMQVRTMIINIYNIII